MSCIITDEPYLEAMMEGSVRQVPLRALGMARLWAERAAEGEVAITGEDGRPCAYLVPADEPVTAELVEEVLDKHPDCGTNAEAWVRSLAEDSRWRYRRTTASFHLCP